MFWLFCYTFFLPTDNSGNWEYNAGGGYPIFIFHYNCSLAVRGVRGERGDEGVVDAEENSVCCVSASKLHTRTMLSPWPDTSNS